MNLKINLCKFGFKTSSTSRICTIAVSHQPHYNNMTAARAVTWNQLSTLHTHGYSSHFSLFRRRTTNGNETETILHDTHIEFTYTCNTLIKCRSDALQAVLDFSHPSL